MWSAPRKVGDRLGRALLHEEERHAVDVEDLEEKLDDPRKHRIDRLGRGEDLADRQQDLQLRLGTLHRQRPAELDGRRLVDLGPRTDERVERQLGRGEARTDRPPLLLEAERKLSELHRVPVLQAALQNPEPADERPVPAPEVEDARASLLHVDPGVEAGQARVVENDVVLARAADGVAAGLQGQALLGGAAGRFTNEKGHGLTGF